MKTILIFTLAMFLISCSANVDQLPSLGISDPTIDTGKNNPDNQTPGIGGDGTGGNCYPDPKIGRICSVDSGDMFGDPNDVGVITVEALNLNNQEFLRGGGEYIIKYRTKITYEKFKSVYSKIEVKRDTDQAWTTIVERLVSNHDEIVSYKWNICPHPQNQTCEFDNDGNPILYNGNDYKIRITSNRVANQSGQVVSQSSFTIDSGLPVLQDYSAGSKGLTAESSANGFVNLKLLGSYDSLTKVSKICLKTQPVVPAISDSCWMPSRSFGASYATYSSNPTGAMTLNSIPIFIGFNGKTNLTYYLWLMDQAGNVSDLSSVTDDDGVVTYGTDKKDMVTFTQNAVTYATNALYPTKTGFAQGFSLKTDGSTTFNFESSLTTLRQNMGDPNSFVVTSAGIAYVKMSGASAPKGILKVDLATGTTSTLIQPGNHAVGDYNGAAKVYDPMKIALDHEENLWIMDKTELGKVVISKVVNLSGTVPRLEDVIGGGANKAIMVNGAPAEMGANALEITYSDNLRWYGVFAPLPDGSLVFSSEDPTLKVKGASATDSYSLRIYTPSRPTDLRIRTMVLNSTDSAGLPLFSGMGSSVDNFRPYGVPTVTYDWGKNDIDKVYFRFCAWNSAGPCAELLYAEFDAKGNFIRYLPTFLPWHFGNEIMSVKGNQLFVMNSYQGTLAKLPLTTEGAEWTSVLSTSGLATDYCANGVASGQCRVRIKDIFISNTGRVFFIDHNRIRFVDDDGKVHSIVEVGA